MKKTFDCVEMKNEIQRQLLAEYEGLTLEEQKTLMDRQILSDPMMGPMYRRLKGRNNSVSRAVAEEAMAVHEESAEYQPRRDRVVRKLRVFVDTSVFGGCFDEGFDQASCRFFDEVKTGRFKVVVSERVVMEVGRARAEVKRTLFDLEKDVESVALTEEIVALRDAYLDADILGTSSLSDAEHIAAATIAEVDLLISWNFKHIVHFDKIRSFNAINLLNGYRPIDIRSPQEVVTYEEGRFNLKQQAVRF